MTEHNVTIYSTPTCPNCKKTKEYFAKNNIEYKNIDVSVDENAIKEMVKKSGQMGVPVIDIDGKIVVGYKPSELNPLLGIVSAETKLESLIAKGAVILDVRSVKEYEDWHREGSINIPVDQLEKRLAELKKDNAVIVACCASGARSNIAKTILETNGFKEVYNGGSCNSIKITEKEESGVCPVE